MAASTAQTDTNRLVALDIATGDILWSVEVPVVRGTLVAGDSLLFVKSSPTEMRALRRSDGSEKWYKEFPGETLGEQRQSPLGLHVPGHGGVAGGHRERGRLRGRAARDDHVRLRSGHGRGTIMTSRRMILLK